ncbi:helix-turn-helix transcriptional regulator [Paenibacillus sp. RC84]|uniref:helix-turn-helix transcriptional regulator n=1 Tax=Paenibacillus TaxID=44249 RepID=UPI003510F2E5
MKYILGRCHLVDLLRELGWSQQELAEKLGVSRQQVHVWCTDPKRKMNVPTLFSVADTMGVDPRDIYELIPVKPTARQRQQSKKMPD